jgi:hypothetical protein
MLVSSIASRRIDLAMIDRAKGQLVASDDHLRKSFAFAYWAREMDLVARRDPNWPEEIGDDLLMTMVCWQALSIACGSSWFALWLAPHLHNQFGHPSPDMPLVFYSDDIAARRFMELLQRSLISGAWPHEIDAARFSGYGKLLEACSRPDVWPGALVDYCDWRIANAYGYSYMGAPKRRRQSALQSVLDAESIEQVIPFELFTLQFAVERATGHRLSLDAPHPMLQSVWMTARFPAVEPMHEDELTHRLQTLRSTASGAQVPLRSPVAAKYL